MTTRKMIIKRLFSFCATERTINYLHTSLMHTEYFGMYPLMHQVPVTTTREHRILTAVLTQSYIQRSTEQY